MKPTPKKLIVELTLGDDKVQTHECVDFPSFGGEFITLYKKGFVREMIRTQAVVYLKHYFK